MSTALLKKFFESANNEDKKCSICLDNVQTFSECYITFNCCAYIFHKECIQTSFNKVGTKCPICNEELLIKESKRETESECESECDNYSQHEIFLINFTKIYTCNCSSCNSNNFYYKLKFAIEKDNIEEYCNIFDDLELDLIDYDVEYTEKIFLYSIRNNAYSILSHLMRSENIIFEYPDSDEALELFHDLAETKNYKMIKFLADWSKDSVPELIGYNDPEIDCILGQN